MTYQVQDFWDRVYIGVVEKGVTNTGAPGIYLFIDRASTFST